MKPCATIFAAAILNAVLIASAQPVLTVNGVNANYTTTHVFVDEVAGDAVPITVSFHPNAANLSDVEVFSNLNRRDRAALDADGDGREDGIVPPDGNTVVAGSDASYYKAFVMTNAGGGEYRFTIPATKTGAYRLTARYRVAGNTNWIYYNNFNGQRDHAIVVSPKKSRDIVLYELNTITVESQGTLMSQRSTFVDLWDGPGARSYDPVTARFNLDYVRNLGANWLWFQPIHPQGIDGRQIDPDTGQPFEVGSPYAVKNFFEIMPLMSKANTREAGLEEFTNFVAAADAAGVSIMLDAPFNHTAYDCELGPSGVFYFSSNAAATDEIRNHEARFYSLNGNYCSRASNAGNIAVAPDRGDFGKFADTYEVFFGRYASLVCQNPADNGNYLNEGDWFDYTVATGNFDGVTQNVWKYFADYILYWLDKTGCPPGTPIGESFRGFDGLRADFGQGLPPQAWEYIINRTRSRKWDFVFMTESLDGGPVTYRSNRHFDILNENIVFALKTAGTANDYRNIFESRRNAYGQGLVLLNNTSHDEEDYDDPFQALIRYAVCSSIDGAPMVFYGQELGISRTFGFDRYEVNFGKLIPHFKKHNSLQPIFAPVNRNFGLDQLYPVYAAIGQARQFSRALRSSNRYFLDQVGGGTHAEVFAVAKYEQAGGAPNFFDVVFAFANLDRNNQRQGSFNVNINSGGSNLFGLKPHRLYNVKNVAAYTAIDSMRRDVWLWGGGIYGSNVIANGVFVSMNPVPTTNSGWTNAPFEAQYLKLYDITPPPAPAVPTTLKPYAIGNVVTFTWPAVNDSEGGIASYHVLVGNAPGGSNVFNGIVSGTSLAVTNIFGATLYARVSAVNNAGIEGLLGLESAGTILLDPAGDFDGDGMRNLNEDIAGTDPLDMNSVLRIVSLANGASVLSWASVTGKSYYVLTAAGPAQVFAPLAGPVGATGGLTSITNAPGSASKFYRIQVVP